MDRLPQGRFYVTIPAAHRKGPSLKSSSGENRAVEPRNEVQSINYTWEA